MDPADLIQWANRNEGLLQAVAMLGVAAGVILSPLGRWLRSRLFGGEPRVRSTRDVEVVERAAAQTSGPAAPAERASIAVLPFSAPPEDPEHGYLVDGLVEDLVTLLARVPGFFVIARQSTLSYRDRVVDVREVGRELGVRYLLQGSVRKLGDRVRVSAQLVETATGTQLWGGRFDRGAEELGRLQDELTDAIAAAIEPELVRAEADLALRRPPADWDAWACYQRAQARLILGGWHEDTFEEAADLLRQAIRLDPGFALARGMLSLLLAFGGRIGLDIDREAAHDEALREGEEALRQQGDRSEVQGYVGCALTDLGFTERGLGILERAVETNPSNAQAWVALGAARLVTGEAEAAVEALARGLRISPQDSRLAVWGAFYAAALARLGRLEDALEQSRLACRRDPRAHIPRIVQALIHALLGREEEARTALAVARDLRPKLRWRELEILLGPFAKPLRPAWEDVEARPDAPRGKAAG